MGITAIGRYLPPRQPGIHHTNTAAWRDFYSGMTHTPHRLAGSRDMYTPEQKQAVADLASLSLGLGTLALMGPVGRAGLTAVQASRFRNLLNTVVFLKRPVHQTASWTHGITWYRGSRVGSFLGTTLKVRKKIGLAALGYSMLNPLESIRYAARKDWHRLFVNLRWPFVGVFTYNRLEPHISSPPSIVVEESSSRDLVQNGGSSAPPPLMEAEATFNRNVKRLTAGLAPSPSSAHGFSPGKAPARRRRRCPPGHHWSSYHKKCVKTYPGWQKHW